MTEQKFRYDVLTIIVLFLILSLVFVVYFPLLAAITLGMTLAIVLLPLDLKLRERLSPAKSAALTTVLAGIVIGLTLLLVVNLLLKGGGQIIAMMQIISDWLMSLAPDTLISGKQLANALDSVKLTIISGIHAMLNQVPQIMFGGFIMFLSVYLFLLKGQVIFHQIIDALPVQLCDSVDKITGMVTNTMYAIYIVSVEIAVLTFVISFPLYYLLGYPASLQPGSHVRAFHVHPYRGSAGGTGIPCSV